jgi:hypothetical protein
MIWFEAKPEAITRSHICDSGNLTWKDIRPLAHTFLGFISITIGQVLAPALAPGFTPRCFTPVQLCILQGGTSNCFV